MLCKLLTCSGKIRHLPVVVLRHVASRPEFNDCLYLYVQHCEFRFVSKSRTSWHLRVTLYRIIQYILNVHTCSRVLAEPLSVRCTCTSTNEQVASVPALDFSCICE
jgi:hypothetical protein